MKESMRIKNIRENKNWEWIRMKGSMRSKNIGENENEDEEV